MMDYGDLITQIRTYTNCFQAVGGGVSLESLDVTVNTKLPAAFVVPLSFEAEPDLVKTDGGLFQRCIETFGVIVVVNTGDLRGQQAAMLIPSIRMALWAAILNYYDLRDPAVSAHAVQGLYYVSDDFLHYDSGRTFWIFKYALNDQITEDDGFQIDYPPLTDINLNILVNPTAPVPPVPSTPPNVTVELYPPNQTNVIDLTADKTNIVLEQ